MDLPEQPVRLYMQFRGKSQDPDVTHAVEETERRLQINARLQAEIEAIHQELKRRDKSGGAARGRPRIFPRF
jgi:uncharacterized small protein (DUF1192 family)